MSPRRRRRGPARCDACQAQVRWLFVKGRGNRKFDVTAIDGRTVAATEQLVPVLPVFGARAWDPDDLIAELESLRRCSTDDARSEVQDMPWHQIHRCHQAIARAIENREAAKR